jgi:hypothetical protein
MNGLAYILGDFFTNASGHPAENWGGGLSRWFFSSPIASCSHACLFAFQKFNFFINNGNGSFEREQEARARFTLVFV